MKAKTPLTLCEDLIASIDKLAGRVPRFAFIKQMLRESMARRTQARRDAREVAAINRHAAKLNIDMIDALYFQTSASSSS